MKHKNYSGEDVRELRRKAGLNQAQFWAPFQTTQSGGSRYEAGRDIPGPVQALLNLAFGTEAKATAILGELRGMAKTKKKTT